MDDRLGKRRMLEERQLPGFDGLPAAPPPPVAVDPSASASGASAIPSVFDKDSSYPSLKDTGEWTAAKITSVIVPLVIFTGVIIMFIFLYGKRRRTVKEERIRTDQLWSARGGGGQQGPHGSGGGLERKESTDSLIAYVEKRESTLPPRPRFGGSMMSYASSMDSLAFEGGDDRRDSRYRPSSFTPSPSMTVKSDPFSDPGVTVGDAMLATPRSDYTISSQAEAEPALISPVKGP